MASTIFSRIKRNFIDFAQALETSPFDDALDRIDQLEREVADLQNSQHKPEKDLCPVCEERSH